MLSRAHCCECQLCTSESLQGSTCATVPWGTRSVLGRGAAVRATWALAGGGRHWAPSTDGISTADARSRSSEAGAERAPRPSLAAGRRSLRASLSVCSRASCWVLFPSPRPGAGRTRAPTPAPASAQALYPPRRPAGPAPLPCPAFPNPARPPATTALAIRLLPSLAPADPCSTTYAAAFRHIPSPAAPFPRCTSDRSSYPRLRQPAPCHLRAPALFHAPSLAH